MTRPATVHKVSFELQMCPPCQEGFFIDYDEENMQQRSDEWLEFRRTSIGASDACAIMGTSPWTTPYELWRKKVLGVEEPMNAAMQRGVELEPEALEWFIRQNRTEAYPKVVKMEDGIHASFDGINEEERLVLEIKCPGRKSHEMALCGQIPPIYFPQLQHILMVTGYDSVAYVSYDGTNGIILWCDRDEAYIQELYQAEKAFLKCILDYSPPPLISKDEIEVFDLEKIRLSKRYIDLANMEKAIADEKEKIRAELVKDEDHPMLKIGDLKLHRVVKKGSIPYAKIPEIKEMDLESYRNASTEYWRICDTSTY